MFPLSIYIVALRCTEHESSNMTYFFTVFLYKYTDFHLLYNKKIIKNKPTSLGTGLYNCSIKKLFFIQRVFCHYFFYLNLSISVHGNREH